jgi:hypothetical protein
MRLRSGRTCGDDKPKSPDSTKKRKRETFSAVRPRQLSSKQRFEKLTHYSDPISGSSSSSQENIDEHPSVQPNGELASGRKRDKGAAFYNDKVLKRLMPLSGVLDGTWHKQQSDARPEQYSLELDTIRNYAKPALPDGAEALLDRLKAMQQDTLRDGKLPLSGDTNKSLVEKILEKVSPETCQDYRRRKVEFVLSPEETHPHAEKSDKGHWRLNLPTNYQYPIQGLILQSIDQILKIEQDQDGNIPNSSRRAEITARVFQINEMLGEKYGYNWKDYKLAENYHKDYYDGIDEAFKNQLINTKTAKETLNEIGHNYAKEKLLERIKPEDWNVRMIFLSTMPGSYFEESSIKERVVESPGFRVTYRAEQPVKVGTEECRTLLKRLEVRKEQGINSTLTAAILPNSEIWVQPAFFEDKVMSQHSISAGGNPCAWAGEIEIEGNKVTKIRDQSGHFRTYNAQEPNILSNFALSVLEQHGYDTSKTKVEFTLIHGRRNLEYRL